MIRGYFASNADGSEKPSVRVSNPSGGKSSFSLGWGSDTVETKPVDTRKYKNQSSIFGNEPTQPLADNRTTKSTTRQDDVHTSVKVHHAPGGQSSISLGGGDAPATFGRKENVRPQNQFATSFSQVEDPLSTKTSVKVHNPPGGRSNFSLY